MCGLIGEINFSNKDLDIYDFKKNLDALRHRGPDSKGHYIYENFFQIGFRRLSIIDLMSVVISQ